MFRALLLTCCCMTLAACGTPEERVESYLARAESLFDSGDYETAGLEVRNALQIAPKNAPARLLTAKIAIEEEDFRSALNQLLIAVDLAPDLLEACLLLGEIYYLARMPDEIEAQVSAAERTAPDDAGVRLLKSRLLAMRGELGRAMAEIDAALAANADLENAIIFKASLLARTGDRDAGIALLDRRIAAMPVEDTERMRNFRIVMLEGAGRDADVEAALRSLARDFPDQERYTQALAVRFTQTGRVDEAERIMRELADRDDAGFARRLDYVVFLEDQRSAAAAEAAIRVFLDETPGSAELRLTLGNLYDSEGRSDEALAAYREVVELAPASDQAFEARNRIASIRFRQGEADEARALIGAILADRPDDVDALLGRAAFNYADGNFDEVVADARSAIRKDSGSAQARLLLARAHARKGEVLLAQDAYQQLLALDPWNPAAAGELAASYLGQGDTKRAESLWRGMLEQRTDDANARLGLIGTLISEGASADAEEQARQLIELDPSDPRGHLALGQVFAAAGRDTDAIAAYRKALEIEPESTAALREFVVLLNGSGAPARAVDYLDGYIEAHPDMPYARLLLASAWQAAGDRARARALYEALIADRALATAPYLDLAAMYDPGSDERRAALASGVEAFPGDAQLSLFLGQEYERAGQIREAIDTYGAALSANADNDLLANNLASLLLDGGDDPDDFSRALEIAQRFRGSRKAPYLDTLGWAYYRNADYPNAVRHLETAVAMAGQIPVLRYHLGMAYLATGNRVNARQELERAVAMGTAGFPGRDEAESSLAGLQAGS